MDRDNKLNNVIFCLSGIAGLWKGIHDQVDEKEYSSTKLWDRTLRFQVNLMEK